MLVWLGGVSYALYMTHTLIIWVVNQTLRVVLKRPEAIIGDGATPQLGMFEALAATFLVVALTLACAAAVHRFVEAPARDASRRFIKREKAGAGALAAGPG